MCSLNSKEGVTHVKRFLQYSSAGKQDIEFPQWVWAELGRGQVGVKRVIGKEVCKSSPLFVTPTSIVPTRKTSLYYPIIGRLVAVSWAVVGRGEASLRPWIS